jgi:hypothetical protein
MTRSFLSPAKQISLELPGLYRTTYSKLGKDLIVEPEKIILDVENQDLIDVPVLFRPGAEVSYRFADHIEVLKAAGGLSPINLLGNALSNELVGNLGANWIEGFDGDGPDP